MCFKLKSLIEYGYEALAILLMLHTQFMNNVCCMICKKVSVAVNLLGSEPIGYRQKWPGFV